MSKNAYDNVSTGDERPEGPYKEEVDAEIRLNEANGVAEKCDGKSTGKGPSDARGISRNQRRGSRIKTHSNSQQYENALGIPNRDYTAPGCEHMIVTKANVGCKSRTSVMFSIMKQARVSDVECDTRSFAVPSSTEYGNVGPTDWRVTGQAATFQFAGQARGSGIGGDMRNRAVLCPSICGAGSVTRFDVQGTTCRVCSSTVTGRTRELEELCR